MYVLGIDAGGTKTVCYLADVDGRIIGEGRGGGANLQAHGELEVEKGLHGVIEDAIGDRAVRPTAVCLAGAGDDPGVVLIAGTGSIAYGVNSDGYAARSVGWGYVLGDEGSGYWLGKR